MSVNPSPIAGFAGQFFDNNGVILSGGKIYTYAAGTTTPQATYTSAAGVTPHANPIVLDSAGRVPGGEIWLTDSLIYKFVIETSTAVLIGTYDNITGVNSNFVNYTVQEEVITATAGQTVFNLTTINYTPGTNSLSVYIDGVNQYVGDSYLETDSDTVTFTAGLHVGAEVKFTTAIQTSPGATDASNVSYTPPFTGSVPTNVENKLAQYVSVKDFGAVGDGVADDTAAIQACYDACPGFIIDHGNGSTFLITSTLNLYSGSEYTGRAVIKAADNALITGAMMLGTSVTDTKVSDLEFDGNANNSGADYGVWFNGGARNTVSSVYIHDTAQAGIVLQSEAESTASANTLKNCGRANSVTGAAATDNHGVMAYSIGATPCLNITIMGNMIDTAYRKGITTYSAAPGIIKNVLITNNVVTNCGLGAIYTGNAPGGTPQDGVVISGNVLRDSYANLQLIDLINSVASNNAISAINSPYGIYIYNSSQLVVSANSIASPDTHGIFSDSATTSANLTIAGNLVIKANAGVNPFGAGIHLVNTVESVISANSVFDADGNMTHGVIEAGSSDYNVVLANNVRDATAANYLIIGANTQLVSQSSSLSGFNINVPRTTVDVNGSFALKESQLTLVAGANQNVSLPAGAAQLFVTGLALPFSVGGIAGGVAGRKITLINYTSASMTLNHNDGGSSAGNRFALAGNANLVVPTLGMVDLVYSAAGGGLWFAVG